MKSLRDGKVHYILFLVFIFASVICGGLVIKEILPRPFLFLSIFLIAAGTTLYNRRNYINSLKETEARRQRRAIRKNEDHNRYL